MSTIFTDIECYYDFFFIGMKRREDGKRIGVEYSTRSPTFDRDWVRNIFLKNTTVGFNSLTYDLPMIWLSLREDVTPEMLKVASDRIIKGGVRWWEIEKELGIVLPWDVKKRHIDLIEPQPNAFASLKTLNGRMHGKRLQDLPYPEYIRPTHEQMDAIADYCLHSDLDATENLFDTLKEPLELRVALGEIYKKDFRSKSDAQIGEAIVKLRAEELTGRSPQKVETKPGTKFRYEIPPYVSFESPQLKAMLDRLRETDFVVKKGGKVDLPDWLSDEQITIGSSVYQMGIGGLHSTESGRCVRSNDTHVLVDADVASQYPSIIMSLGLAPMSLGVTFLDVYGKIKTDRLKAKKRAKEIKDELPGVNDPDRITELKLELLRCNVMDKGAKIQLNGVYGKLGSPYSILYAPHLLIATTLTGQLTLLMLAERAEARGISVVSGNTDGLLFYCPRDKYAGLKKDRLNPSILADVTDDWERTTGFDLEFGEYRAIYNQSVNSYYAIKADGGHKRKGPVGNPWSLHPDDFDQVRGQLMKNPQMTICSDAALAFIKDGTPIEKTVNECTDIKQFVTVIKASNGAIWTPVMLDVEIDNPDYQAEMSVLDDFLERKKAGTLLPNEKRPPKPREKLTIQQLHEDAYYLGKTVRYYWAVGGGAIYDSVPNESTGNYKKVSNTEGAADCMMLPDTLPGDIDYEKYISEAKRIVEEYGFYNQVFGAPRRSFNNRDALILTLVA
jgi:hypothetical protein